MWLEMIYRHCECKTATVMYMVRKGLLHCIYYFILSRVDFYKTEPVQRLALQYCQSQNRTFPSPSSIFVF